MKLKKQNLLLFFGLTIIVSISLLVFYHNNRKPTQIDYLAFLKAKKTYQDGLFLESEKLFYELIQTKPNFFQAQLGLAKSLYFQDKYLDADKVLQKLLVKKTNYQDASIWKIRTEIMLGKYIEAEKRIDKELLYNSENPILLFYKARISELNKNYKEAIDFYSKTALFEEEAGKARLELANLYWSLNLVDKSKQELKRAIEILPSDSILKESVIALDKKLEGTK